MDLIDLAQDRDKWRAVVNGTRKFWVPNSLLQEIA